MSEKNLSLACQHVVLSIEAMASAYRKAHPNVKTPEQALALWASTYEGCFDNTTQEALQFAAFQQVFLQGELSPTDMQKFEERRHVADLRTESPRLRLNQRYRRRP